MLKAPLSVSEPRAELLEPVAVDKDLPPTAVFFNPVKLDPKALYPNATLPVPVVLATAAEVPTAVLLLVLMKDYQQQYYHFL